VIKIVSKIAQRSATTFRDFRAFALRANAVDLAIGVSLGAAFTAVVTSIVTNVFTPLIAAIWNQPDFSTLTFKLHGAVFRYGLVVNAIVSLIIITLTLYFMVVKPLNSLRRRLGLDTAASLPKGLCPACYTEIDVRATRCPSCTQSLTEGWSTTSES
jgi:large conductance mechanosensitive channel